MRIGSLFSGAGGLDMGVQAVIGGTIAWHSEIDPGACRVLAHRYPSVPNLGDITAIDWRKVEPVDVLTGGFPCQDVSSAGRQAGLIHGTRSGLWHQAVGAIAALRPALVIIENVRGLLSSRGDTSEELEDAEREVDRLFRVVCLIEHKLRRARREQKVTYVRYHRAAWVRLVGQRDRALDARRRAERRIVRAIGTVVGSLAELGYDATWHGLRASDVGAPHGRFRVFVVAHPTGNPWRVEHGDGGPTSDAGSEHGQQWRLAAPGQAAGGRALGEPAGRGGTPTLPTPTARDWKGHNERRDATCLTGALMPTPRASDGTHVGPGQRGSAGDLMLSSAVALLPTPTAMDSRASGGDPRTSNTTLTDATVRNPDLWGKYGPTIRRWEALTRPAPAATQPSARTGNPQLAPRFSEWLMGWPAGWVTDVPDLSRNEQLRIIGNGVVPQQAAAGISWCLDAARQYGGAP